MSRSINLPPTSTGAEIRIPPGVFVAKFYREGTLELDTSGFDSHPAGARLIRLVAYLVTASTSGSVMLSFKKNEYPFYDLEIPEGERLVQVDISTFVMEISMDFRAVVDTLQVEITNAGTDAAQLTVLGVFDR